MKVFPQGSVVFCSSLIPHTTHIGQPLQSWPVSINCCKCHHKPTLRSLFLNYYIQVKFFCMLSLYVCGHLFSPHQSDLGGPDSDFHQYRNIFCGTFNVSLSKYLHWSHFTPPTHTCWEIETDSRFLLLEVYKPVNVLQPFMFKRKIPVSFLHGLGEKQ